ncbi:RNA dependent RNA polymerase [Salipaludibacillus sp. CF4.18]|uniref:RNA dependent RNA polymerase n=1 Tax=Salipaludibacillus sp. CF4.18 TaxID=3373081 RepID=UPI003EE4D9FA
MTSNLSKQVYIYSLTTHSFYNETESGMNNEKQSISRGKEYCKNAISKLHNKKVIKQKDIDEYYKSLSFGQLAYKFDDGLAGFVLRYIDQEIESELINLIVNDRKKVKEINNLKSKLFKKASDRTKQLEAMLDNEADNYNGPRKLTVDSIKDSNKVSQFDSVLSRSLDIDKSNTTDDIFMIKTYRYKIFKQMMDEGFTYNNKTYKYFTSSAGAIRNKKCIFIEEDKFTDIENKMFAGLTRKKINDKDSLNPNKFNAYTALTMTASIPWEGFDIDRCVVVDDFETNVNSWVDHIDSDTYEVKPVKKDVTIPHTDGAGMCLPGISDKSLQFRMPFFKGLLIPFEYDKFISRHKNSSPFITDIWGETYDVIKDDIQIIFTKSQFKAAKFFDSWMEYKVAFRDYECESSIVSVEMDESKFEDKTLSYQVLQTLTSATDEELNKITSHTVNNINSIANNADTMLSVVGATDDNENKNSLQQALSIYPNLLNDNHSKKVIKDTKTSLVKRAKSGKLILEGSKRAFIAPDLYAFCEWLFIGYKNPIGLLANGEVYSGLYKNGEKLDVLRNPHCYKEHAVRENIVNEDTKEWFISNCIYTSTHDLISKILQFDVDGDEAIICNDETLVNIAEREMKDVLPLDYELSSAEAKEITNNNLYNSLKSAYKMNIGESSNKITKCFNADVVEEEAMKVAKWLTFENNATIDYAKTLWMPKRPPYVDKIIKEYTGAKLPYFFLDAKDKKETQVEGRNDSVVNRISKIIDDQNKRIYFKKVVGEVDFKQLLYNQSIDIETDLAKEIIATYNKLNATKHFNMKKQVKENKNTTKKIKFYIIKKIGEVLEEVGKDPVYVTDVLVKYLYSKGSVNKDTLWDVFGHIIVSNLKRNVLGLVDCIECSKEIDKTKQRQIRCKECQGKRNKRNNKIRQQKKRQEEKLVTMS